MRTSNFLSPLPVVSAVIERDTLDRILAYKQRVNICVSGLPAVFGDVRRAITPAEYTGMIERYAAAGCDKIAVEFGFASITVYVALKGQGRS